MALPVDNMKKAAITNTVWKFMERICAQVIAMVVSIILARLLAPEDYTVVSVVMIFFNFANVIISGGFNTALIQKTDADEEDYSTVLHLSVAVSLVLYGVLFFAAPFISRLYRQPLLVSVIRVMALSLPLYAVKSVYCAYISSTLQFRKFFWATLGGTLTSAVVGITMATKGFGPWALVAQQVTSVVSDTLILVAITRLRILLRVSWRKLKGLFSYGWKVFVSSLLGTAYNEAIPLFIGIKFPAASLSFYTKGKNFPTLISTTTTSTLSAVLFPVLARYQDDHEALLRYTRRFIRTGSYLVFPLMLGFFAVSDNFVLLLLTEKWLPAAYYIRVFCAVCMLDIVHIGNCETIKAMGRSDVYLIMEIIKKSSYFVIIGLFMFFGKTPELLALASFVCALVAMAVNSVPNRKLIGYSFRAQAADLVPNLLLSVVMCAAVTLVGRLELGTFVALVLQSVTGVAVYVLLSVITRNESFRYLLKLLKSRGK